MIISDHPLENPFLDALNNLIYGTRMIYFYGSNNLFYGQPNNFIVTPIIYFMDPR